MKYLLITFILGTSISFTFSDNDLFPKQIDSYVQLNKDFMHLCDYQNINWDNDTLFITGRADTEFSIYDILLHHWVNYISYEGNLKKNTVVTFTVPVTFTYQVSLDDFHYHFEKKHLKKIRKQIHFNKNEEEIYFKENQKNTNLIKKQEETHFFLENDGRKVILPWPTYSKEVNKVQYFKGKLKLKKFVEFKMTLRQFIKILKTAKIKLEQIKSK